MLFPSVHAVGFCADRCHSHRKNNLGVSYKLVYQLSLQLVHGPGMNRKVKAMVRLLHTQTLRSRLLPVYHRVMQPLYRACVPAITDAPLVHRRNGVPILVHRSCTCHVPVLAHSRLYKFSLLRSQCMSGEPGFTPRSWLVFTT